MNDRRKLCGNVGLRKAEEYMQICLSKSGEARKYSISLGTLEYSGDLSEKMMSFSTKMEAVYQALRNLVAAKNDDPGKYKKYFHIVDEKAVWFKGAEAMCWMLDFSL